MKADIKKLIEEKNYDALSSILAANPELANEGITIPYDYFCRTKAHPLHRICDGVFAGKITDSEAIQMAKIFLANGANIDGDKSKGEGTPLLAAASLHAEQTGIFFIDLGADVHYVYKGDGASALHWAAYCGRDELVNRLIAAKANIDGTDAEHHSTPLGWAVHALMTNDQVNTHHQATCIKLLLKAGADQRKLRDEMKEFLKTLGEKDAELKELLK